MDSQQNLQVHSNCHTRARTQHPHSLDCCCRCVRPSIKRLGRSIVLLASDSKPTNATRRT